MESFLNNSAFGIKEIEYLVVIAFLILLVPFGYFLNKRARKRAEFAKSGEILTSESIIMPQGLFFSRYHTWTFLERSGSAKVGLDDLLVHITGKVQLRWVLETGEKIRKGDFIAELEQNNKMLRIYSPIAGEVLEVNPLLAQNPELINSDPYQEGWILKIKPFSWVTDIHSCFLAEDADMWARQELLRFKDFLAESVVRNSPDPSLVTLQDGGELCDQPLAHLPNEIWQEFQQDFLSRRRPCKSKANFDQ
jgi:glycine cleavage system H protein